MRRRCQKTAKQFARASASLFPLVLSLAGLLAFALPSRASGPVSPTPKRLPIGVGITPTLGTYPATTIPLSADTTVTPNAAPTNTTSMNVSASTNFKGTLEANPATGVVRVTDAHPAGSYTVTVKAFSSTGESTSTTFYLTVTTSKLCVPVTFAAPTPFGVGAFHYSVAVGDFNGDGRQDIAVTNGPFNGNSTVSILLGDGAGSFSAATDFGIGAASGPESIAVGDFNGDGNQDLVTANVASDNVSILLGDGAGSFSAATPFSVGHGPVFVAVGDFNGDGKQDLAVANYYGSGVSILLGDGTGSFSAATNPGVNFISLVVGDFNGDGKQDLAVASQTDSDNVSILLGDGLGGFGAATMFDVPGFARSIAVGDFNGDGRQDLAVGAEDTSVFILLGDGAGSFSGATGFGIGAASVLYSIAVGDFNGDGKQDLATAGNFLFDGSGNASILLGDGAGGFGAATNFTIGDAVFSIAVGDFNADGRQDLAVDNFRAVSILLRDCAPCSGTLCHKHVTTIKLPCDSLEYQRHLDHGDTVGACPSK